MLFIYADKDNLYNKLIVNILYTFIEIFNRDTHYTNITEEVIKEKIEIIERDERNEMTSKLKNLNDAQRKISNVMKELKLNEWSIGLTKKLWQYDDEAYDEIREKEIEKLRKDRNSEISKLRGDILYDGSVMLSDSEYNLEDELTAYEDDNKDEMEY